MKKILSIGVSVSLMVMSSAARSAPREGVAARLEVDTSDLGGIGPVLKERLNERGAQVLRDENITAGGADDPAVTVTVRELDGEDPGFEYEIRLDAASAEDDAAWEESCVLCTEAELIDAVADELDEVASALRALERPVTEHAPPPVLEADPEPTQTRPPAEQDRGLDTKGRVGIGLLALGVVAAGTGVGLVLAPARPLANDPLRERYTQPPGYAALAVGGVALVTGAVLLGLSLRHRKRATARSRVRGFALRWGGA